MLRKLFFIFFLIFLASLLWRALLFAEIVNSFGDVPF
jgi:hypothetical protein